MTNAIIDCVHDLALRYPCRLIFYNRNCQPLSHDYASGDSDDDTYLPSDIDDSDYDYPYDSYEHGGVFTPPICDDAPTGVYDYHEDYALDAEPPGDNQVSVAIKEEECVEED